MPGRQAEGVRPVVGACAQTRLDLGMHWTPAHQAHPICLSLIASPWATSKRYPLPPTWTSTCTSCVPVT